MPRKARQAIIAPNQIYHIVSRGNNERRIFRSARDYRKFVFILRETKKKFPFYLYCYSLMPNHYHFLLKQIQDKGVSIFMRNFQNSYARYFNTKYKRAGGLFQSMFKAVRIETDEQLIHVSRYIHLNPSSAYLVKIKELETYPWSSFPEYIHSQTHGFTNPKFILNYFKTKDDYKKFVFNQAEYQRELQKIKHLILEE